MRGLSITAVLILATVGVIGSVARVGGQAASPSRVDTEILWQYDTGG